MLSRLRQCPRGRAAYPTALLRSFHASRASFNERTPFQVFVDTFRKELKKSKELQNDIKQLQSEGNKLSESSAYKTARDALERSRKASSATSKALGKAGDVVGTAASATWNSAPVKLTRTAVSKTADAVDKVSEPIRKTELYQDIKEVIDDGTSIKYGGFEDKEARIKRRQRDRVRRQLDDLAAGRGRPVKADETAGQNVIVHETAKASSSKPLKDTALGKRLAALKAAYDDSDNGLVSAIRGLTDTVGGWLGETEAGQVARRFKEMDPAFSQEMLLQELRNYILPEVLDAYAREDAKVLKNWLSEASFGQLEAKIKGQVKEGVYCDGKLLDIRNADIVQAKMMQPANVPVYIVSCRAQEISVYKSIKTNEVKAGVADRILMSTYVMVLTRVPENIDDDETQGWKILEIVRGRSLDWT